MTSPVFPQSKKISAYLEGVWVDLSADVISDVEDYGGISGNGPMDRIADVGTMGFLLRNASGKYTPDGEDMLAGWGIGVPILLELEFDDITYRFLRYIDDPTPIVNVAGMDEVKVTLVDWMDYAATHPLVGIGTDVDKRADQALTTMLAIMAIPPQATDFDEGETVFPAVFDAVTRDTKIKAEMEALVWSDLGYLYLDNDEVHGERLVFENASRRNGLRSLPYIPRVKAESGRLTKADGGYLLKSDGGKLILNQPARAEIVNQALDFETEYGKKNIINSMRAKVHFKKVDTVPQVLFSLDKPLRIGAGQTINFQGIYSDAVGGSRISAVSSSMIQPINSLNSVKTSLLHFDNTNWIDESGKIWTPYGGITMGVGKWGGDAQFDKIDNYLTSPSHEDFEFGSGDFTIEWWEWRIDISGDTVTMARDATSVYPSWQLGYQSTYGGNYLRCYFTKTGSSWDLVNGLSLGTKGAGSGPWTPYAVVRNGNNFYGFKNGVLQDTIVASGAIFPSSNPISIGKHTNSYLYADIDEVRITKGLARYTASGYTPQTAPFVLTAEDNIDPSIDYLMNSAEDGSGTDLTDYLEITVIYNAIGPFYTLCNTSNIEGWVWPLQARGLGVRDYNSIEVSSENPISIGKYSYQEVEIDQLYQQDGTQGLIETKRIVERERKPRTRLHTITFNPNESSFLMQMFLRMKKGSLVGIKLDQARIDGHFYIQAGEFKMRPNGLITAKWLVKEAYSLQKGLTLISCEFGEAGTTDGINYGYLPQICDQAGRTMCAWIYPHDASTTFYNFVCGTMSDGGGNRLMIYKGAISGLIRVGFYSNLFNVAPGTWGMDATSFPINTLHHVAVSYAPQDVNADPLIYLDGEIVSSAEYGTPAGALNSEYGCNFMIGNIKTNTWDYLYPFDGQIKDVRGYNRILTPTEVKKIYLDGISLPTVKDGLVFQGPCVRTAELAHFTDLTLGADDFLLDAIRGAVAEAHGAVVTRLVGG